MHNYSENNIKCSQIGQFQKICILVGKYGQWNNITLNNLYCIFEISDQNTVWSDMSWPNFCNKIVSQTCYILSTPQQYLQFLAYV